MLFVLLIDLFIIWMHTYYRRIPPLEFRPTSSCFHSMENHPDSRSCMDRNDIEIGSVERLSFNNSIDASAAVTKAYTGRDHRSVYLLSLSAARISFRLDVPKLIHSAADISAHRVNKSGHWFLPSVDIFRNSQEAETKFAYALYTLGQTRMSCLMLKTNSSKP